jgi:hypothetical protein
MAQRSKQRKDEPIVPASPEGKAPGEIVEHPATQANPGVRPEMIAVGRQVIAERRKLLERLAAYDRGEDAGR